MTPFILAQTDLIGQATNEIYYQFGAVAFLLLIVAGLVGRIWLNSEDAKVERQKSKDLRDKEDTRRDASILDNSIQLTKTLADVNTLGISLAEERGKVNLLTVQIENLRDKNQKEREELKKAINDLALKVEGYELEIAELKASVNGKALEIKTLTLERDKLSSQLKDRDARVMYLEKQVSTLEEQIHNLRLKAEESARQIESLGQQLANLDPVSSGDTGKMTVIADVTIKQDGAISEIDKEHSSKSEE